MTAATKTAPRVLISDALSPAAVAIFKDRGVSVDVKTGLAKADLIKIIGEYDGLAIRSSTKVDADLLAAAPKLRVVGRAGIGVDNVDIRAATARGVIVMNTPFGNSITTAEHAISMMMALARQIPEADRSTRASKWEKSRFMGVELFGKTLGVIGCGNIGAIVADRAQGLKMRVIAFDPFLSPARAMELGVTKVELSELLTRADFITLHTPLTDQTRNILDEKNLAKTKKGVRIVNCARGGLIDEKALLAALKSGHVAGAALDVFEVEPAKNNPLFDADNVICTPHLGAATTEAQENVALQVAEQMADYLLNDAVANAVNFPSITAEEAPRLKPFAKLCESLGSFAGQLTMAAEREHGPIKGIEVEYCGQVATLNTKPLTAVTIANVLKWHMGDGINMVSAKELAETRGIAIKEVKSGKFGAYESYVKVTLITNSPRSVGGTVFSDGRPRFIQVRGINMEFEAMPHMLYIQNHDKPGFVGRFGTLMGTNGVNIATFNMGRDTPGGEAICIVAIDEPVKDNVLSAVKSLEGVKSAALLKL
ncbi:MAG: D-3-phosphoglycerate dehydrogenase [Pseudomonadota bacterium]